jgi:hypothetical protein
VHNANKAKRFCIAVDLQPIKTGYLYVAHVCKQLNSTILILTNTVALGKRVSAKKQCAIAYAITHCSPFGTKTLFNLS